MSDIIIAFILGIVEGLAEFLPISSTGHLILVGHLLGFEGERAKTFEIVIQLGAILAIAILYHKRLVSLCNIKPLLRKEKKFNAFHVFLGVFPAVVAGLLLHDIIKTYLFQPYTVVIGLVAGAILMIFAEVKKKEAAAYSLDDLTYRQALTIGLFQCLAVYPGFSRAGSTISGGLLAKVNYKTASEFSFLIALPVMVGATGLDLLKKLDVFKCRRYPYVCGRIHHFFHSRNVSSSNFSEAFREDRFKTFLHIIVFCWLSYLQSSYYYRFVYVTYY